MVKVQVAVAIYVCCSATVPLAALTETQRVQAFLTVGDALSAAQVAEETFKVSLKDSKLWELYLQALSQRGDERGMLHAWHRYADLFPDEAHRPEVLETMAWGVIKKGAVATTPLVRIFALLAACLSNDAKGVEILTAHVDDPNMLIRTVALQLSAHLRDEPLKAAVLRQLPCENFKETRIEAIRAIGKMQILQGKPQLLELLSDPKAQLEEREAAILSLVEMTDSVDREQLRILCTSSRAGLRHLGCQLMEHFECVEDQELLLPLLADRQAQVKVAALRALGRIGVVEDGIALSMLDDPNPSVAITACWLLTLRDPKLGQQKFERWLAHPRTELKLEAATALVNTGQTGLPLMIKAFKTTPDLDVRLNLALGLIGLRQHLTEACEVILEVLTDQSQRWMTSSFPLGEAVMLSTVRPSLSLPDRPEVVNQLTRLELFSLLASLSYPRAEEGIIPMLQKRSWGICGLAAAVLLTEGDEEALELIEPLLQAEDAHIRIQAALILAFWGKEENALAVLQEAYPKAHREMKERILEAMGRVGNPQSIPFLVEQLASPHQTISLVAAAALLQCLYH